MRVDADPPVSLIVVPTGRRARAPARLGLDERSLTMAKGIEKGKKDNKPKLSIKEKQKKKKEKQAMK
jgi:hypothetical protein